MTVAKLVPILKEIHSRELTLVHFLILALLHRNGESAMKAVKKEMGYSGSAATGSVDYLQKVRLVSRRHDPNDRRQIFVSLTTEGKSIVSQIEKSIL